MLEIVVVAIVYAVAGKLSLLLAIPPGYATAVWPAAGIALAAVLLCGYRVLPGVWIGSFLVNCNTSNRHAVLVSLTVALFVVTAMVAAKRLLPDTDCGKWLRAPIEYRNRRGRRSAQ